MIYTFHTLKKHVLKTYLKMKKIILFVAVIATTLCNVDLVAQSFKSLDVSPMDAAFFPNSWRESNKIVKVVYSRPQLKGRDLAMLAPVDKVWRTGANEATEITFFEDVIFGGKNLRAGSYSLFTIPSAEGNWTVIINKARNVWGSYTYKEEQDVLRVAGKVSESEKNIEAFSMMFDKNMTLHMGWGKIIVSVPIKKTSETEKY